MKEFIDRHQECISGILSGFDRLILRGTLRAINYGDGLLKYLNMHNIRLTQFDGFAECCTKRLVEHFEQVARELGRPCLYLESAKASKEQMALRIARRDRIDSGLVCVLSCVEPCMSAYDKRGSVLRIETTVNDPARLRVFRAALNNPAGKPTWRAMSKSVADTARRCAICRAANARYLSALAGVGEHRAVASVLDPLSKPIVRQGERCRGLRPLCPDEAQLFAALIRGENLFDGVTNATLQRALYTTNPSDPLEKRRRSGCISRKLRLLRHHGLIQKIGRRRLYRVTFKGHQVMSLALNVRRVTIDLLKAA